MERFFYLLAVGVLMGFITTGCSFFGKRHEEQPFYKVIQNEGNKEIRKYDSFIIAQTTISSRFKHAQKKGFRILSGYIFGNNKTHQKISMTAPVLMVPGDNESWTMMFIMPSLFKIDTLPVPGDERVQIEKLEEKIFAVIRFSGFWNEARNEEEAINLRDWLKKYPRYEVISPPIFAACNPPWTIPFLRTNEMLIELRIKENVE
jgi:hypothetical protein